MRAIAKGAEPPSLTAHRHAQHCNYDNYADKSTLRSALISEQRGLCCYCMARIQNNPAVMKLEHWQCQSRYPSEQLSYRNLLAACLGGDGQPPYLQHCDTKKGDRDLRWNPADPDHHIETRVRYEPDGSIRSDEAEFDAELTEVLNLNLPELKNCRKGVLDAVIAWWKAEKQRRRGAVPRASFESKREMYIGDGEQLTPFCQVAVYWLNLRLARMP